MADYYDYDIALVDEFNQEIQTINQYVVCDAGDAQIATIYDLADASKTNPVTNTVFGTDGYRLRFRSAATTVDISIVTAKGSLYIRGVPAAPSAATPGRRIEIKEHGTGPAVYVWPYATLSATNPETSLAKLPVGAMIGSAFPVTIAVYTVTSAACSAAVGLLSTESNGDANGFVAAQGISAVGYKFPAGAALGNTIITTGEAQTVSYTADTAAGDGDGFIVIPYIQTKVPLA